jgi:hypothetical protein
MVNKETFSTWEQYDNFKDKVCKEICIGKVCQETVTEKVYKKAEQLLNTILKLWSSLYTKTTYYYLFITSQNIPTCEGTN